MGRGILRYKFGILEGLTVPVYKCPSSALSSNENYLNRNDQLGQTHDYVGIMGSYPGTGCSADISGRGSACENGILFFNGHTTMRDVTDGTSNTIYISEQSGMVGNKDIRANYHGGWSGFYNTTQRPSQITSSSHFPASISTIRYAINLDTTSPPNGSAESWHYNTILNSFHTAEFMFCWEMERFDSWVTISIWKLSEDLVPKTTDSF